MSTANKVGAMSESIIAQIAGNLLSGMMMSNPPITDDDFKQAAKFARAIVAEVERTRPSGDR